ncbi:MAG TPA: hypothetical protein VKS81_08635, partial [Bacteroidota bacterium]|nr:hypothetical protein [Bacteroidota bacterium]
MNILLKYWYLLALCLFLTSCEKSSDTLVDPSINSPFLISDSVSVSQIFIDSLHQNADGTIPISFTISARAYDRSGISDLRSVSYAIYPPGSAYAFLSGACTLTSAVTGGDTAIYTARLSFSIDKSTVGFYNVGITATTQSNTVSNTLLSRVLISKNFHRPYLTDLYAPDTVVIPAHGKELLQFAVSV